MAKSMSIINVNVPTHVKEEATEIFNNLGLNMSTAINMFLRRAICEKGIPFEVREEPSDELKAVLKELEDYENGKVKLKSYTNVRKMFEDIEKDED